MEYNSAIPLSSPVERPREVPHNTINNVRVCFRIRPLIPMEITAGEVEVIKALPDRQTIRLIPKQSTYNNKIDIQEYRLDRCFCPTTTQEELFHDSGVKSLCDSAIAGHSATVFCYGQTGGGKTYTMSGPQVSGEMDNSNTDDANTGTHAESTITDMGVQYRSVKYIAEAVKRINSQILEGISKDDEGKKAYIDNMGLLIPSELHFVPITIKASYLEIYNEQVNDLLNQTSNLKIHWSQTAQSFYVENLMIVRCDDITDMLEVLQEGARNRKRGSHKLNSDSSRSHVIFTLYFERRDSCDSPVRYGKMHFADLAGSEKLKESKSVGTNAEETKFINTSLFTLGKVISALSKRATKHQRVNNHNININNDEDVFVPYRDSALTKLLMDTLGGNCATLMVACVSPAQRFIGESMRTIKYAIRAKNIVNCVMSVRIDPTLRQIYELKTEVEMLKKENLRLRRVIAEGTLTDKSSCVNENINIPLKEDSVCSIQTAPIVSNNHPLNNCSQTPIREKINMYSVDGGEAVCDGVPVSYRKRVLGTLKHHPQREFDEMSTTASSSSSTSSDDIAPLSDVPLLPRGTMIDNICSHSQFCYGSETHTSGDTLLGPQIWQSGDHSDESSRPNNTIKNSDLCCSEISNTIVPLKSDSKEVVIHQLMPNQLKGFGFKAARRRGIGLL